MDIKPLRDRVVVKPIEMEEKTKSGIVLPETAKEKPQQGEVIAAGAGRVDDDGNRIPLEVNPGDRIIYSKYGGSEVKVEEEEYLILREDDILAVVEK